MTNFSETNDFDITFRNNSTIVVHNSDVILTVTSKIIDVII